MRGRGQGQGRFQDRSTPSTFMRSDPYMPPAASSEPLSASWTELNYVGGRGLGGPSPSRPPPSLFSQSMAPDFGVMGMQGAGGYDNSVPYGCGRSQTRMRDRVSLQEVLICFFKQLNRGKFVSCKICSFLSAQSNFRKNVQNCAAFTTI